MPLENLAVPHWMGEEAMPSPAPEFARRAIQISMNNDHAALEALRAALASVPTLSKLAERTGQLFVSASFCVDPTAATPYLPIPLHEDTSQGPIRIAPERFNLDRYQRALLNVSRSMQLADDPVQGHLSWVHISGQPLYPGLDAPLHVKSVAEAEAKAIGAHQERMMFVPLPQFSSESDFPRTAVVIILWWKEPSAAALHLADVASSIQRSEQVNRWAGGELRRLQEGDATRYQLLIYLRHIEQFLKGKGPRAIEAWKDISHNTGPYLVEDASRSADLTDWMTQVLSLKANPMNAVTGVTDETPVLLRGADPVDKTLPLAFVSEFIACAWRGVRVTDAVFAQKLVEEALTSIAVHDCLLQGVEIDVTKKFCHIAFELSRGRALEVEDYFAIRRGLFVPSTEGLGIGLALFSRRASMQGAFRALYVSPDGSRWKVDVAVPISGPEVEK